LFKKLAYYRFLTGVDKFVNLILNNALSSPQNLKIKFIYGNAFFNSTLLFIFTDKYQIRHKMVLKSRSISVL